MPVGFSGGVGPTRPPAPVALAREPDDGVDLGQRGGQLVAGALGEAAGDHELRSRVCGRPSAVWMQGRSTPCRAASMNAQVFTTTTSASSGPEGGALRRSAISGTR